MLAGAAHEVATPLVLALGLLRHLRFHRTSSGAPSLLRNAVLAHLHGHSLVVRVDRLLRSGPRLAPVVGVAFGAARLQHPRQEVLELLEFDRVTIVCRQANSQPYSSMCAKVILCHAPDSALRMREKKPSARFVCMPSSE